MAGEGVAGKRSTCFWALYKAQRIVAATTASGVHMHVCCTYTCLAGWHSAVLAAFARCMRDCEGTQCALLGSPASSKPADGEHVLTSALPACQIGHIVTQALAGLLPPSVHCMCSISSVADHLAVLQHQVMRFCRAPLSPAVPLLLPGMSL